MTKNRIHIIGGGIIGLCSAWFLRKQGWEITVIDKENLLDGTSFGNAGMIVPSHFVPLASPGAIWKGIKWMFDRKSPFAISSNLNLDLIRWAWHFKKSSTTKKANDAGAILRDYNTLSKELYQTLIDEDNFTSELGERGLLMAFQNSKTQQEEIEIAEKADALGIKAKVLDEAGIANIEKAATLKAMGGVYYPDDCHLDPGLFMRDLIRNLQATNVQFITNREVVELNQAGERITEIQLDDGTVEKVSQLLLSTGSWSQKICSKLSIKILLQPGKGYSLTLKNPPILPTIPTILCEAKVAVTPLKTNLRIGGTMEIGNFNKRINKKKVQGIIESLPKFYDNFDTDGLSSQKTWQGWRPCTPDGLPYLGRLRPLKNTVIATGHAMMGLSMGPATGKIVAEIFDGQTPSIDLTRLHPARF